MTRYLDTNGAKTHARESRRASLDCATGSVAQSTQGEATVDARTGTSVGMLLTSHVLQDGEVIMLVLKPSLWFILLSSLWFVGGVLLLLFASILLDLPGRPSAYVEAAAFVIAGRVMWAVLQWMGRLYILTDMRILRLSGVFSSSLFNCPLRRVARTRLLKSMRERIFRLGSIEIIPADEQAEFGQWQMVARPHHVHEQIIAAINRAKQGRIPSRAG